MSAASWVALAVFAVANFAAASSGAVFKPGPWYASLRKPPWTPPNWAFPLTWTVLFCLNAVAGWRVWEAAGPGASPQLALYGVSLLINAAWSYLFFGRRRMDWAMVDVAALWFSILATIFAFAPIDPLAAWLQIPYISWVSIAALLNLRMVQLNRPLAAPA